MIAIGIAIGIEIAIGQSGVAAADLTYDAWTDELGNPMTDEADVNIDFTS